MVVWEVVLIVVVAYDMVLVVAVVMVVFVLVVVGDGVVSWVVVILVPDVLTGVGLNVLLMFLAIRGILFPPGAEKLFLSSSTNCNC